MWGQRLPLGRPWVCVLYGQQQHTIGPQINAMRLHFLLIFTILFKIITRMKFLFWNLLGDYSYSFQGSSELALQLQFPCVLAECSYRK